MTMDRRTNACPRSQPDQTTRRKTPSLTAASQVLAAKTGALAPMVL